MMCLIYFYKGATLTTKKSIDHKAIIQKRSKDFGGSLDDTDVIKLCGCSRNTIISISENLNICTIEAPRKQNTQNRSLCY